MTVEICLLGEFELRSQAVPHPVITAQKARALLAYLCVKAGRPQQRSKLARLLWGDVSQDEHARKSLRQALSVVRRDLPPDLIEATRGEVCVKPSAALIDVHEFERLAKSSARQPLEQAVTLYRGELLEGFQSHSDAFDDWLASERRRLREQAITTLERLLELQREAHDLAGATGSAIRMVSLDPLREAAHRKLMRLYAEQGRLGDALDQFENCRQVLQRELGHGPAPATVELLQQLRHRDGPPSRPRLRPSEPSAQLRVVAVLAATWAQPASAIPFDSEPIAEAIDEQGGQLLRRTANSVVGVFGTLRSQGSEGMRAVVAAQRAAAASPETSFGVSLAQAMVTHLDGSLHVVGEAVSHAAHLASTANAGAVVVSESIRQVLRDSALARDFGVLADSGAAGRLGGWRVTSGGGEEAPPARLCFVGRNRELGILRAALAACRETETGQLIRIHGEAGIGKTRLLEELLRIAVSAGFRVHRAAALDFGSRSERDVIAQLTRSLMPRVSLGCNDQSEPVNSRDRGLLMELAALAGGAATESAEWSMREARAERQRELWVDLWHEQLEQGPTLVAIEDLHWAEDTAREYLALLLGLMPRLPLLVVATSRPGQPKDSPSWQGALRRCAVLSVGLAPLSVREGRQLADELAIGDPQHVEAAIERSAGHPLFLEQILRARKPAHLTPSIHVVVQTRLDELAPPEAGALRAAAVLGHQFELGALSELLQNDVPTEALLRSGLIKNERSRFMFAHALIRDAIYETLPPAARRSLHIHAAEVVRQQDRALSAQHLERACDPGAAQAYLEAAEEADRCERVLEASKLAARGLALASETSLRHSLRLLQVRLLRRLGQRDAAEQNARDTLAVAITSAQRTRAWLALAECLRGTPRDSEALDALQAAETEAAPDDHAARSHIHYLRGSVLFPRAESQACLAAHEQALSHSKRAGSAHAQARALSGLGDAYYIRGDLQRAAAHFQSCASLSDQLGLARLARVNRIMNELVRLFRLDEPREAFRAMLKYAELARDELDLPGEAVGRSSAIYAVKLWGDAQTLETMARQVVDVSQRSGLQRLGLAAGAWLLEAQFQQGAGGLDDEFAGIYARCTGPDVAFAALNILGSMITCCRDTRRREELYSEADRILEGGQFVSHCLYSFSRSSLFDCLHRRDHERLEQVAQRLEHYTAPHQVAWGNFFCDWARSLSAWQRGRQGTAARRRLAALGERARQWGLVRESEWTSAALESGALAVVQPRMRSRGE